MQNIFILAISGVFILFILGLATLIAKLQKGSSELSRKFVHIMVGNWIFITPFFTELWAAVLIPFVFIFVNALSHKYHLVKAMERNDDSFGTVYYAVSLFILTLLAHVLQWHLLSFVGILTMAYGDGLAALLGEKYGKRKPFSFAPKKSLLGSATVFVVSFLIAILSLTVFADFFQIPLIPIWAALLLSVSTGIFAVFLELQGKKGCDNLTLPIGTGLFLSLFVYKFSVGLIIYLVLVTAILILAFTLQSITMDACIAAFLTAITLFTLGSVWVATSLLVFFILGSAVSRIRNETKKEAEARQQAGSRRNWKQVLANSLPASILCWLYLLFPGQKYLLLLALIVFSAAAADTFSSELGMLSRGKVYDILHWKPLPSGVSGGVSLSGCLAGLLGSSLLSVFVVPEFGWLGFTIATILGFFGSLLDSVLGSLLQRKYLDEQGKWQDIAARIGDLPARGLRLVSNNMVNLLTLTLVSLVGLLYFHLS